MSTSLFTRASRRSIQSPKCVSHHVELLAAGLLAVSVFLIGCHSDRRESFYPSFSDARKAGAIDRGWIPEFLPVNSHQIHELHEVSSSTTWCAFEFIPANTSPLKLRLEAGSQPISLVKKVPGPGKPWWPEVLTGNLDPARIHATGLDTYVLVEPETGSTNEALLFVVDWSNGRGFFFRMPLG